MTLSLYIRTSDVTLQTESALVSEKHIASNHVESNLHVQQLNFFGPHGVLNSEVYTSFSYVHRGHSDEAYCGLFGVASSVLLTKETVVAAEWYCVFCFDQLLISDTS